MAKDCAASGSASQTTKVEAGRRAICFEKRLKAISVPIRPTPRKLIELALLLDDDRLCRHRSVARISPPSELVVVKGEEQNVARVGLEGGTEPKCKNRHITCYGGRCLGVRVKIEESQ